MASAIQFSQQYPDSIKDVLIFGLAGALGQLFIFYTLERFGSLVLVTVNVTRKMLSMILSVIWFNHHLTRGQWTAVGVVFGGIALEAQMTRRRQQVVAQALKDAELRKKSK